MTALRLPYSVAMNSYQERPDAWPFQAQHEPWEDPPAEDVNPYLAVWTRPRAAIRHVVATKPEGLLLVFVAIAGVFDALGRASMRNAGDEMELGVLIAGAVVGGSLGGLISYALSGWLISVTGRWLGGQADAERVRYALGWTAYMSCVAALIWIPQLALFGRELFTEEMPSLDGRPEFAAFLMFSGIVEITLGVWIVVCGLKMIGEVHGFSAWRALGAAFLAGLLVFVPIALVVFAFLAVSSAA